MKNSSDPTVHRQREQQLIQHVERLLNDDRLRLDTSRGNRAITTLLRDVAKGDRAVELKRTMSDLGLPDRELQARMPAGESLEVTLSQTSWWVFKKVVGRLRVVCVSPTRSLLKGEAPAPVATPELQKIIAALPPSLGGVPTTVVLMSTSGFTIEAHEVADRRPDRTIILVEPNDAGGWTVIAPPQTKSLADLFDPEVEEQKRSRLREYVEANKVELLTSGIVADRIAAKTQLPLPYVEAELKGYAKENPGLNSKRLDGRVVLYREGANLSQQPAGAGASGASASGGGSSMPLLDTLRALFSRKGENEKKIAFLAERRAALSQQRDRSYEDMSALEQQEAGLRQQFKDATGAITKRRITSQLLQLRKDLDRRQQLLAVLNQQINVVSTHLHNLELVQQGQTARLPDAEEMTADAVKAEEMLADLEASNELAGSTGELAHAGMTDEERALYDELEREAGGDEPAERTTKIKLDTVEQEDDEPAPTAKAPAPPVNQASRLERAVASPPPEAARQEPRRPEPEAG
jgi:hypothetical protein